MGVAPSDADAMSWYLVAAEQGFARAQVNLANLYRKSRKPADLAEAVRWYRIAAAQGYPPGQHGLAVAYAVGAGVKQDVAEAVRLYRQAAEQGVAPAQMARARLYLPCECAAQNRHEA